MTKTTYTRRSKSKNAKIHLRRNQGVWIVKTLCGKKAQWNFEKEEILRHPPDWENVCRMCKLVLERDSWLENPPGSPKIERIRN